VSGEHADEEIRDSERKKMDAERQFKALQMKVLGLASESVIGDHEDATELDPSVIIARQQEQLRKAEYDIKEQKKKQEKLRALQKKLKGEQSKTVDKARLERARTGDHDLRRYSLTLQPQPPVFYSKPFLSFY
jgi:hypothetical protein